MTCPDPERIARPIIPHEKEQNFRDGVSLVARWDAPTKCWDLPSALLVFSSGGELAKFASVLRHRSSVSSNSSSWMKKWRDIEAMEWSPTRTVRRIGTKRIRGEYRSVLVLMRKMGMAVRKFWTLLRLTWYLCGAMRWSCGRIRCGELERWKFVKSTGC